MEKTRVPAWTGWTEWLNPPRVAAELSVSYGTVLAWTKREIDPLPMWYPPGNRKQGRVRRDELNEWIERNWERKEGR